ncbi:hypothetical protein J2Z35_002125 [Acetoanaerobium pronyense]|uniref:Copper amine oxidase-like N-terminal domain-containing protein n=1 Tax=Acetoanaerobium pronyense TaxID=1482736 RepID=A0ABS4KNX8_9FIRM|nr:copper amine oxidase N-terminal domain-containing protein [Acetoanaerobium pronyense]MBP2028324.1 hypothetical protein [Acetoanaerobium pronyense]
MNRFLQGLITIGFLAAVSVFTATVSLAVPSTVQVFVDGTPLVTDQPAVIRNSRTMVPFNVLFTALGAEEVNWNEPEQKVTGKKGDLSVELFIGKTGARVNGESVNMDTPVQIINSRTMVPLAFVSRYLGAEVNWDGVNYIASVKTVNGGIPDIFDPIVTVPSPVPPKDTSQKSNIIAGIYVAENMKGERFAIQFNNNMTIDIKNLTSKKEGKGSYTVSGNAVSIDTEFIKSNFMIEELRYNNRNIVFLRETSSDGRGTTAMTPVPYEEFAKIYQSN